MPGEDAITYRLAGVDDIEAIGSLRFDMDAERHPELLADRDAYIAAWDEIRVGVTQGSHIGFLAESGGAVIACAMLIWWVMPPALREARRARGYVSSVYTKPGFRRLGIGRQIMENLMTRARELGITRLLLNASEMGRPLYLDLGFKPTPFETLQWDSNPRPQQ
jgi:GNAT superfamily N-acetyltransferase